MNLTTDEIAENFALFSDWEERYQYLIDLGKSLPHLDEAYKADLYKVRGCTSQVWLVPDVAEGKLRFQADSDALIVKGLIAVLMSAYNAKTPSEISEFPIKDYFDSLGLGQNLSPNRRNGFFAMVEKIKSLALAAQN